MIGPVRTPAAERIKPGVNRSGSTLPTNKLVGYGTPDGNEHAIDSLHTTGVGKIAGAIQHSVADDDAIDVFTDGDLVLESDGSGTISVGDQLYAVAGASLAAGGRVKAMPGSPVAGTNYEIVGRALTAAAATAGAQVVVRWERFTYQG